jgi:hypothetical protein
MIRGVALRQVGAGVGTALDTVGSKLNGALFTSCRSRMGAGHLHDRE